MIYITQELDKQSFIQKIFKKLPKENFIKELHNVFSKYENNIEMLNIENILEIAEKYKVKLNKRYKDERTEILNKYLRYCLEDEKIEESEIKALKHIKDILMLTESDMNTQIKILTEELYNKNVNDVISDGILEDEEKNKLDILKKNLLISEDVANDIYNRNASEFMKNYLDNAVSDERLSPAEEKQIEDISKSLGIEIKTNEATKKLLEKYKIYWQIENGEIPSLVPDINIQKSETLYFKGKIKWNEQRRVTKRINYGGPTVRIKIAKGIYWRAGSISPQRITEDEWKTIDTGTIFLTNKRIIFMGNIANKNIRLNKILDFTPYKNGVDIQKDTGKSPFFEFSDNVDIFSMILARLMLEE